MPRQKPKSFYFTLGNFLRTLSKRKSAALRQFHAREVLFYSVLRVFIEIFVPFARMRKFDLCGIIFVKQL